MRNRLVVVCLNNADKVVGAQQSILRADRAAEGLNLFVDFLQTIRLLCSVRRPSGVKVLNRTYVGITSILAADKTIFWPNLVP